MVLAAAWGVGITLFVSLGHPLGEVLSTAAMGAVYTAALWYIQARSERTTEANLDS
ncbi:hypothetical protein BJG92_02943 [Arthrobacter sp. SO5]|nr:hypothetical protein [Arthrobacter sp. SO5]